MDAVAASAANGFGVPACARGISLVFAELKDPVRRKIERYGLTRSIDLDHFFPTVRSAVAAFRRETGAE